MGDLASGTIKFDMERMKIVIHNKIVELISQVSYNLLTYNDDHKDGDDDDNLSEWPCLVIFIIIFTILFEGCLMINNIPAHN